MYHVPSMRPPIGSSQATAMTNTGPASRTDKIPVSKGKPTMVVMAARPSAVSCSVIEIFFSMNLNSTNNSLICSNMFVACFSMVTSDAPKAGIPVITGLIIAAASAVSISSESSNISEPRVARGAGLNVGLNGRWVTLYVDTGVVYVGLLGVRWKPGL